MYFFKVAPNQVTEQMETDSVQIQETCLPSALNKTCMDKETQTNNNGNNEKLYQMKKRVKTLKQKIKRRDRKILNMKDLIEKISSSGYSNENLNVILKNYFEGNLGITVL